MYYLQLLDKDGKILIHPDEYYSLKEAKEDGSFLVRSGRYLGYRVIKKTKSIWD